jgi:putative membrane protein
VRHHIISHVLLAMVAPIAVVLGCPTTLALQSLPREPARRLVNLLQTSPVHFITRPAIAVVLNVGAMFLLYLTPLYALAHDRPVLSGLLHVHFFLAGSLFAWVVANQDRVPGQSSLLSRLVALGLSAAAHAYLGKLMFAEGWPSGTGESLEQVRAAAQIMYYGGDVAELLLAVAIFGQWYARRRRRPLGTSWRCVPTPSRN